MRAQGAQGERSRGKRKVGHHRINIPLLLTLPLILYKNSICFECVSAFQPWKISVRTFPSKIINMTLPKKKA